MRLLRICLLLVLACASVPLYAVGITTLAPTGRNDLKDLIPKIESVWTSGTHHILWSWDPLYFGTAARLELWNSEGYVLTLGYKWDCGSDNDFEVQQPLVQSGSDYQVRIVSIWSEMHPEFNLPTDAFTPYFTINNPDQSGISSPTSYTYWSPDGAGNFTLSYAWNVATMGTASRIDLLDSQGNLYRTLGYYWFNKDQNTITVPDIAIASGTYTVRVTSLWLEANSSPATPTYLQNKNIYITFLRISRPREFQEWVPDADGNLEIAYGWTPQTMGTVSRIDLYDTFGKYYRTLAYNWDTQVYNDFKITDDAIANGVYVVRVTSVYLEMFHDTDYPQFLTADGVLVHLRQVFHYSQVHVETQLSSPLTLLNVGLETMWQIYGSAYRVSLQSINSQQEYTVGYAFNDAPEQDLNFWVPPLPTDETAFNVVTTSIWQEQHPSVPKEFRKITSRPVYILNPHGVITQ